MLISNRSRERQPIMPRLMMSRIIEKLSSRYKVAKSGGCRKPLKLFKTYRSGRKPRPSQQSNERVHPDVFCSTTCPKLSGAVQCEERGERKGARRGPSLQVFRHSGTAREHSPVAQTCRRCIIPVESLLHGYVLEFLNRADISASADMSARLLRHRIPHPTKACSLASSNQQSFEQVSRLLPD